MSTLGGGLPIHITNIRELPDGRMRRQWTLLATTVLLGVLFLGERLTGGEFGVNVLPTSNMTVRGTWFDNRVENPVANVTLTAAVRNAVTRMLLAASRRAIGWCDRDHRDRRGNMVKMRLTFGLILRPLLGCRHGRGETP